MAGWLFQVTDEADHGVATACAANGRGEHE